MLGKMCKEILIEKGVSKQNILTASVNSMYSRLALFFIFLF